jgi:hypothetical protein
MLNSAAVVELPGDKNFVCISLCPACANNQRHSFKEEEEEEEEEKREEETRGLVVPRVV